MQTIRQRSSCEKKEGFILLLTVLVTSVILAISFSIFSISLKELIMASFLKNSAQAFVSADRGVECALFWDRTPTPANPQSGITYTIFATSSAYQVPTNLNSATCNGTQLNISSWSVGPRPSPLTGYETKFRVSFADATCVDVIVLKDDGDTTVTANGFNNCSASSERKTQRTIQVRTNL